MWSEVSVFQFLDVNTASIIGLLFWETHFSFFNYSNEFERKLIRCLELKAVAASMAQKLFAC